MERTISLIFISPVVIQYLTINIWSINMSWMNKWNTITTFFMVPYTQFFYATFELRLPNQRYRRPQKPLCVFEHCRSLCFTTLRFSLSFQSIQAQGQLYWLLGTYHCHKNVTLMVLVNHTFFLFSSKRQLIIVYSFFCSALFFCMKSLFTISELRWLPSQINYVCAGAPTPVVL